MRSLFFFLICILVAGTLGSTTKLTLDNIKGHTAQGNWFVLQYQSTAPTSYETKWDKLVDSFNVWKQHGVYFGKVDCSKEPKLCDTKGGDRIAVYLNGNVVSTFPADTLMNATNLRQHIVSSPLQGSVSLTHKDELVAIESSGHPWFVKYYAPWCGHCKNLAPIWDTLASEDISINMAEVNCETDKDLCSSQKVAGLPTLKFYNGDSYFDYAGDRTLENFKSYLTKMTGPATQTIDRTSLPSIYENPVSMIYIHQQGDNLDTIKSVAKKFMDSIPFYTTNDPEVMEALEIESEPGQTSAKAILIKDGGAVRQVFDTEKTLEEWIRDNKYPLVTRISSGNANDILKGDRLVVLMFTPDDTDNHAFRGMARSWIMTGSTSPRVVFAELNGQTWSKYVKRVYGISSRQLPAMVILDPINKVYYNQDLKGEVFSIYHPDGLFTALSHLDQLVSYSTTNQSVSGFQKMMNFLSDHSAWFAIGLLGICGVIFAVVSSGSQPIVPETTATTSGHKKKDD